MVEDADVVSQHEGSIPSGVIKGMMAVWKDTLPGREYLSVRSVGERCESSAEYESRNQARPIMPYFLSCIVTMHSLVGCIKTAVFYTLGGWR